MSAPDRIWASNSWQTGYRFYAKGPQPEFDNVEFRRADLCADPALFAEVVETLRGAVGALEFSRDYHADLGNEEQAFAQDKLDAALAAIAKAEGRG